MPRNNELRFFNKPHKQVTVGRLDLGVKFLVDEGVAVAVQRLLNAGFRTLHSCQWEGPRTKKSPAYINPGFHNNEWERIAALHREKARLGACEFGSEGKRQYGEAMQAIAESPLAIIKSPHDMAEIIGRSIYRNL